MLESYTELARGKHSRASPNAMARNNAVQREIGLLEARLSAARAFLHEAAGQVYDARRRPARSTSICACACGSPPPSA